MNTTQAQVPDRAILERALAIFDDPGAPAYTRHVEDAMHYVLDCFLSAYDVYENPDAIDSHRVGEVWMDHARDQLLAGIMADLRTMLFPATAARLVELLRDDPPPPHLVAHVESDQLRADLAALEGES